MNPYCGKEAKAPELEPNIDEKDSSSSEDSEDGDDDETRPALAVCVSGGVRSFPREAFRTSFQAFRRKMPPMDVFVVLKMSCDDMGTLLNSEEGVEQFMKSMRALRPKAVLLFDRWADARIDAAAAASQLCAIDESFRLADAYGSYAYYLRYRPDFIMLEPGLTWALVREDTIYTSRKLDAPASDQAFLISQHLRHHWWGQRFRCDDTMCVCPEYTIFNTAFPVQNGPCFQGGLLRPAEAEHILMWETAPQQRQPCTWLKDEIRSHRPLPLSHRPLQGRFRDMIEARMRELRELHGMPSRYVSNLPLSHARRR